jgi:hypothetical protein
MGSICSDHAMLQFFSCVATPQQKNSLMSLSLNPTKRRCPRRHFHVLHCFTGTKSKGTTCHYILVINTPRLCGEPGFKLRIGLRNAALIRCRQVVDAATLAKADSPLPEADHPFSQRRPPVSHPPWDAAEAPSGGGASQTATRPDTKDDVGAYDHNNLLHRVLEVILQKRQATLRAMMQARVQTPHRMWS